MPQIKVKIDLEELYKTLKSVEDQYKSLGEKLVLAIMPFGTPGSGKSTFHKTLEVILKKLNWSVASVSSDEIRKEEIDKLLKRDPSLTRP